jgi:ankyrin repeat protein
MPVRKSPPTRTLRAHPDLAQLKRQAKELLHAFEADDAMAVAEVRHHYRDAPPPSAASTFALHDAQLVLARAYGFDSWPKLKAFVDGATVGRLVEAVRAGDIATVTALLNARPELVDMDVSEHDEHRALHHAVLQRQPEIVRLLMQRGADAHKGIWPHRDATSPLTLALERNDHAIVDIIRDEEARRARTFAESGMSAAPPRPPAQSSASEVFPDDATASLDPATAAELTAAFRRDDEAAFLRVMEANPALVHRTDPRDGMTALDLAAACLWDRLTSWLIERGANPCARTASGQTPLDLLGVECDASTPNRETLMTTIGERLQRRGAERTARWAVANGDAVWLRARHAQGALMTDPSASTLVSFAVVSNRAEMVTLLLELGFDPDERERVAGLDEVVFSWGGPLRQAAMADNLTVAEILLAHGADPNTNVYAASSALATAYERKNADMMHLLEAHGGFHNAVFISYLGLIDRARQLFDDEAAGRLREGMVSPMNTVAESMFEGAADTGNVELLRLVLDHIDWPAGHERWQGMLMRVFGRHAPADRERFVTCFRMMLDRSGVDVAPRFGRTILHDVAAAWPRSGVMGPEDCLAFATVLLDRGARVDVRDDLLKSTPLGWACRWGRPELVALLLERGADPIEADAEPWARPRAWAERMGHAAVIAVLEAHSS